MTIEIDDSGQRDLFFFWSAKNSFSMLPVSLLRGHQVHEEDTKCTKTL